MKKLLILFFTVSLMMPSFAQEQSAPVQYNNVIKANALTLIVATGSAFYERKLTDITSAQLGVGFMSYKFNETKLSGLFLTPEFRFYIRKDAIDGFFMSPYLRYMNCGYENPDSEAEGSFTNFGGGLSVGRQWVFDKGFVLELFFGGHYGSSNFKTTSGDEPEDLNKLGGFRTRVGFCLGFAF